ncbi:MAG: nucleotide exchange factor GrpE, partial [Acetobacteraceae bacterium]|nr:nucleotide exchange factor GrpE [Acetobacteraceae bacterium]
MNSDTQQTPAASGVTAPTQPEEPQEVPKTPEELMQAATARIAQLETEAADTRDRWMRAEAEMANVRARARREVDETRQFAVQKFAADVVE